MLISVAQRSVLTMFLLAAGAACSSGCAEPSEVRAQARPQERQAWLDFLADIRAKGFESAYARMAPVYREAIPFAQFRAAIEANPLLARHSEASTYRYSTDHAEGQLVTPFGSARFEVHLAKGQGEAAIVSVLVAGVPVVGVGVPAPAPAASGGGP